MKILFISDTINSSYFWAFWSGSRVFVIYPDWYLTITNNNCLSTIWNIKPSHQNKLVRVFTAFWMDTHVQILHDMYWIEEDKSKQQIICLSLVSTIMKCVSLFLALSGSFIIQMIIKQDILFPQVYSTSNTQKSATNPEITVWRRTSSPVFTYSWTTSTPYSFKRRNQISWYCNGKKNKLHVKLFNLVKNLDYSSELIAR